MGWKSRVNILVSSVCRAAPLSGLLMAVFLMSTHMAEKEWALVSSSYPIVGAHSSWLHLITSWGPHSQSIPTVYSDFSIWIGDKRKKPVIFLYFHRLYSDTRWVSFSQPILQLSRHQQDGLQFCHASEYQCHGLKAWPCGTTHTLLQMPVASCESLGLSTKQSFLRLSPQVW